MAKPINQETPKDKEGKKDSYKIKTWDLDKGTSVEKKE